MEPRWKVLGVENVPREISYKVGHPIFSLDSPFNLKIHSNKYERRLILAFFHVFGDFFGISQSMRPRGKIVGVENVSREISYKVGHSRVSLDLPFNLQIH